MVRFRRNERGDDPGLRDSPSGSPSSSQEPCTSLEPRCCADGGVTWSDLTGFQRDLLMAIRRCTEEELVPTGRTINDRLESRYDEEINNGRLYQNLGDLVERGLLEKGFVDGRTNTYSLSEPAADMLDETICEWADICGIGEVAKNG